MGKYELKDKLGQGTFGLVFTARDTDLDRDVAIKILNPSHQTNGDILHRFLQEARASARIAHPGIVMVLDCGKIATSIGDTAWIVLELLQGESLTNRLARSGKIAAANAVEIARQIASAIDAAHRCDVLHRDLKPDNVYLVPDPAMASGERVKVLDFGLAKLGASRHTTANTVFGTPRYMSPEQCRSATNIDHRSDIYSLGCMLFELVTGRTPFDGDLRQLIEAHQRATPPRARSFSPEISHQLDELIAQMLAKDPAHRPQSMMAVQAALYGHGAQAPGAAATMMPAITHAAPLHDSGRIAMPAPQPAAPQLPPMPQMMTMPPIDKTAHSRKPKRRRAPIAAAAIAFFVAAALTAVAARGRTRSASAAVVPTTAPISAPVAGSK
ncbi:MAG: serine/threonine-protein kinase [Kofleriaceae bacterium]